MFFDSWSDLVRVFLASIGGYVALVMVLRITGKRGLSKLNAFDFVVTVALGSTLATVLLDSSISLTEGVLAFAMLTGLQYVVAKGSMRWRWFRRLVRSDPRLLVENGRYLREALREERLIEADIDAAPHARRRPHRGGRGGDTGDRRHPQRHPHRRRRRADRAAIGAVGLAAGEPHHFPPASLCLIMGRDYHKLIVIEEA